MGSEADRGWIIEHAKEVGFDLCGIVCAQDFPDLTLYSQWLDRGYAGQMKYLEDPRRYDPRLAMATLRSVVVCALNYNTSHPYSTESAGAARASSGGAPRGWISRYAWGDDYHKVMWEKLNALVAGMRDRFAGPFIARAYADTGPVAERAFAKQAGLGWVGKNTLLLSEEYGSWLFLGVILTSLDLATSIPGRELILPDLCGNCRQCIDACPTGALVEPYVLDARRCISYLTIEHRGTIPEEFRAPIGWEVYGCDVCQDVCPYNRTTPITKNAEFEPRKGGQALMMPELEWLATMSEAEFRKTFRNSAVKRTKWAGLVRNACLALGNAEYHEGSNRQRVERLLGKLRESDDSAISESADWALRRIQHASHENEAVDPTG